MENIVKMSGKIAVHYSIVVRASAACCGRSSRDLAVSIRARFFDIAAQSRLVVPSLASISEGMTHVLTKPDILICKRQALVGGMDVHFYLKDAAA